MKRILIVLVTVFLVIGLVACGGRQSLQEAAAEKLIESMAGEGVDIDIDDGGDSVTIKTEEGEVTFEGDEGGMPWPSDKLPAGFPMLSGVTVTAVIDSGTGIIIGFEDCNEKIADDYISAVKAAGWNIKLDLDSEGLRMIAGDNAKNETLQFSWQEDDGNGQVMYGKQQ